jgi:hypothetical protein
MLTPDQVPMHPPIRFSEDQFSTFENEEKTREVFCAFFPFAGLNVQSAVVELNESATVRRANRHRLVATSTVRRRFQAPLGGSFETRKQSGQMEAT